MPEDKLSNVPRFYIDALGKEAALEFQSILAAISAIQTRINLCYGRNLDELSVNQSLIKLEEALFWFKRMGDIEVQKKYLAANSN